MFILVSEPRKARSEVQPFALVRDSVLNLQTTISDLVQISPEDIEKPSGESLEDNINAKYANKVRELISKKRDSLRQL